MLLATTVVLSSCWRVDPESNTDTSKDVTMVQGAFDDMQKLTEDASKENASSLEMKILYGDSMDITIDPAWPDATFPKTITLDFGEGVIGLDGKTRSGIITIVATGPYQEAGATFTTTPENYFVNDYQIQGVKTVTNNGLNESGNLNYDIVVTEGSVTSPSGNIATWESTRNREWISGQTTTWFTDGLDGVLDDTYSITGNASGVNGNDRAFTFNIVDPLIVSLDCYWVKQGVLELSPEGLNTRTLNYGMGVCDNEATLTVNSNTYDITLW